MLAAVLCPHPPLLFRELTGRQDVAAELRAACHEALGEALALEPSRVVVAGAADQAGPRHGPPPVRGFGTTGSRPAGPELPLSLGVGRRLLDEVGWTGATALVALPWDATEQELEAFVGQHRDDRTLLVALGDGSARRGERAPGFLDERGFAFDTANAKALAGGDASALARLDVDLARELMMLGRTAYRLLGALGAPATARLAYDDDPFGVSYHVALWTYA